MNDATKTKDEPQSPARSKPSFFRKLKLFIVVALALIVLVLVFQNTGPVTTKFLFFTFEIAQPVLMFGTLLVGFVLGVYTANKLLSR